MSTATKNRPQSYVGKTAEPLINSPAWRRQQLDEAIEAVAYWTRIAAATPNLVTRADALARVTIWKTTRDARAEKIQLLRAKH